MGVAELHEGDEITIGDMLGLTPGGLGWIHHGAPKECLAVWKVGKVTPESAPITLLRQGRKPDSPPTPHFMGCGCDGYREGE